MGARKLSGLLHELLKPTSGELALIYYSKLLYSGLRRW
jgi:hypothetical protein